MKKLSRDPMKNGNYNLRVNERYLIGRAVDKAGGVLMEAAILLGVSPKTLGTRIKEYGIELKSNN